MSENETKIEIDPYPAIKLIKGTVTGIYKIMLGGTDNVQVVVKLDEGGGTTEFSAAIGEYSVGDRIGDE
ncbi:hypothetical protein NZ35_25390 [Pseudomonas chlororaphis]|uniref:Uncharacterized protein n=1 Tax=Pseudomonas chlororaphis TaxID=587753 RepID=A0A0A6D3L0_9PSED|nr:hypothetical protein NZ35_25390 [Pseudomonas chlororaphis]